MVILEGKFKKKMINQNFLEITLDPWLDFQESFMNIKSSEIFENLNQELDMIHVTSEHPTYDFQVGNLVALVSRDSDPFWLATVTKVYEETLEVAYFHHGPFKPGKKLIWKPHHSNRTCGRYDVYIRFKGEQQLFTKGKTILKKSFKKDCSSLFKLQWI
jgi:hypothetical protein